MDSDKRCLNCKYYDELNVKPPEYGRCHRNAPSPRPLSDEHQKEFNNIEWDATAALLWLKLNKEMQELDVSGVHEEYQTSLFVWPTVHETNWCGDFVKKED